MGDSGQEMEFSENPFGVIGGHLDSTAPDNDNDDESGFTLSPSSGSPATVVLVQHPVWIFQPVLMPPPPGFSPVRAAGRWVSPRLKECKFCKANGEPVGVYTGHILRCNVTGGLVCPVLRAHVCEICGATGDQAHTRNYCPELSLEEKMKGSVVRRLRETKRQSNGIRKR